MSDFTPLRGQPKNAGQFRSPENGDPEADMTEAHAPSWAGAAYPILPVNVGEAAPGNEYRDEVICVCDPDPKASSWAVAGHDGRLASIEGPSHMALADLDHEDALDVCLKCGRVYDHGDLSVLDGDVPVLGRYDMESPEWKASWAIYAEVNKGWV